MKVAVVMGSKSDMEVCLAAVKVLKRFGIETDIKIMSAHRTPDAAHNFALNARENGFGVIIAGAGKAAHLAGVLASYTTLPVIGIPIKSSTMDGLDSLLSIVQMPTGVPVATVAINGAENAGLLAVQILSLKDEELAQKFADFKTEMTNAVLKDNADLQKELKGL